MNDGGMNPREAEEKNPKNSVDGNAACVAANERQIGGKNPALLSPNQSEVLVFRF